MTRSALKPGTFRLKMPGVDLGIAREQARLLSKRVRVIARGQDVLFHGTRYREHVLASGFLKPSSPICNFVAFTRSHEVAAYCATLMRDEDEEAGAIFVFDRASLKAHYKLECHHDQWLRYGQVVDEFEERVWGRNVAIAPHLVGVLSTSLATLSHRKRAIRRAKEMSIETETADCSCGERVATCSDCRAGQTEKKAAKLESAYPGISKMWRPWI
jgi:hypothetical protein